MKFEPKSRKEVLFKTVNLGDVIKYDNRIFLVIEDVSDVNENIGNVVDVLSGEIGLIFAQDEVELLNVVLKEV